jgi:hypothetical protein
LSVWLDIFGALQLAGVTFDKGLCRAHCEALARTQQSAVLLLLFDFVVDMPCSWPAPL